MLHISMIPDAIYAYNSTLVTIKFLLKEIAFCTNLRFSIYLPDNFTRISGDLEGVIGLIQKEQFVPHTLELFCKVPSKYEIKINDIFYYNRVNQKIAETDKTFSLMVVQKPDRQSKLQNRKERCIETLKTPQLLYEFMNEHFNMQDLRTLLFRMQIDYEIFPVERKPAFVQEIILYCHRYGRFAELVKLICRSRPNVKF